MEDTQCDFCHRIIKKGAGMFTVDVSSFSRSASGHATVSRLELHKDLCQACGDALRPKLKQLGLAS